MLLEKTDKFYHMIIFDVYLMSCRCHGRKSLIEVETRIGVYFGWHLTTRTSHLTLQESEKHESTTKTLISTSASTLDP